MHLFHLLDPFYCCPPYWACHNLPRRPLTLYLCAVYIPSLSQCLNPAVLLAPVIIKGRKRIFLFIAYLLIWIEEDIKLQQQIRKKPGRLQVRLCSDYLMCLIMSQWWSGDYQIARGKISWWLVKWVAAPKSSVTAVVAQKMSTYLHTGVMQTGNIGRSDITCLTAATNSFEKVQLSRKLFYSFNTV